MILLGDGEASCMTGILTHLRWLKGSCWDALSSCLTRWTKPLGTSLPLSTLTDLGRSKSELIAENALLRQQLIILRRQVKRPTFTRTDRMLLILLAKLGRNLAAGFVDCATRHPAPLASRALSPRLETEVKDGFSYAEGPRPNHRLDQADGDGESTVGC